MVKVCLAGDLENRDWRDDLRHPAAHRVTVSTWRIQNGNRTTAWLRYTADSSQTPFALYYDGTDEHGQQAWCRSFNSFGSACAWAMQHAATLTLRARTLGPSLVTLNSRAP